MGQKKRILVCPLFCLFLSNKYCTRPLKFLKEALVRVHIFSFFLTFVVLAKKIIYRLLSSPEIVSRIHW